LTSIEALASGVQLERNSRSLATKRLVVTEFDTSQTVVIGTDIAEHVTRQFPVGVDSTPFRMGADSRKFQLVDGALLSRGDLALEVREVGVLEELLVDVLSWDTKGLCQSLRGLHWFSDQVRMGEHGVGLDANGEFTEIPVEDVTSLRRKIRVSFELLECLESILVGLEALKIE
jgi:hypothetical protein